MPVENHQPEASQTQPSSGSHIEFVVPDPDETLFTAYANNVQVGYSHFDMRLMFGEIIETTPEKIVVEQRAQITISYLQAKLLLMMMAQALQNYESQFGEVKLLPGMVGFNVTQTVATIK